LGVFHVALWYRRKLFSGWWMVSRSP
jgi:hypothetical protein